MKKNKQKAKKFNFHALLRTIGGFLSRSRTPFLISASVFSLLYWLSCGMAGGFGLSILWIWLLFSLLFATLALWYNDKFPFRRLRRLKWLRIAVTVAICLLIIFFVTVEAFVISGMRTEGNNDLEYIIVLGAHVRGTTPSAALRWRITRAYEYLTENPNTVAILSGGQGSGEEISEAECMRRELTALGIPESRLILEDNSTSTAENMEFSFRIIGDLSASVGIVTNNFHVWRSLRTARAIGAENICGISAPFKNALLLHYMVREFFSFTANLLKGNLG